jgi:hypothetical protein
MESSWLHAEQPTAGSPITLALVVLLLAATSADVPGLIERAFPRVAKRRFLA